MNAEPEFCEWQRVLLERIERGDRWVILTVPRRDGRSSLFEAAMKRFREAPALPREETQ